MIGKLIIFLTLLTFRLRCFGLWPCACDPFAPQNEDKPPGAGRRCGVAPGKVRATHEIRTHNLSLTKRLLYR